MKIEKLDTNREIDLQAIRKLEKEAFNWLVDENELDELLVRIKNIRSITVVIRDKMQKVVGYIIGVPADSLAKMLLEEDADFKSSRDMLYIDTFVIEEMYRGSVIQLKNIANILIDQAKLSGYSIISAHVPTKNWPSYEKLSKAMKLRMLKNWFGSGEDHFYIEFDLKQEN